MIRLHKLLIPLLMLILPLQGLAAVFSPLQKSMTDPSVSAMPCHQHAETPAAQGGTSSPDEHTSGPTHDTDATNHSCCHHVFTCTPLRAPSTAAHKFSDVSRVVLPLATLFIPDSPDRPPRG